MPLHNFIAPEVEYSAKHTYSEGRGVLVANHRRDSDITWLAAKDETESPSLTPSVSWRKYSATPMNTSPRKSGKQNRALVRGIPHPSYTECRTAPARSTGVMELLPHSTVTCRCKTILLHQTSLEHLAQICRYDEILWKPCIRKSQSTPWIKNKATYKQCHIYIEYQECDLSTH